MTATRVRVALAPGADAAGFRDAVRRLIAGHVPPEAVAWTTDAAPDLFGAAETVAAPPVPLPRAAADLVRLVICHRDPDRHALLYALIWRLTHGEPRLLSNPADPLVHRLQRLAKAVRRDLHKMHAFLRFRRVDDPGGERFVAWFEPDHHILDATAQFFVDRFRGMDWTILTPDGSLRWDGTRLARGPGARRSDAPATDAFEAGWRGYYEAAFNPARLNMAATRAEMPKKYWRNLPEAAAIPDLIRTAPRRVEAMIDREAAMPLKKDPARAVAAMADQAPRSLEALNRLIAASEPLVPGATQAVLGEGPIGAALAFVGEQPGDEEDLAARPFVGPAGRLFDRALAEAGVDRGAAYVTNAVKHFKFTLRGKRRIHAKPTLGEIKHYRWWLRTELELVGPRVVVALGGTALTALAGRSLPVGANRGPTRFDDLPGAQGFVTVHPSYLLRLPDEAARRAAYAAFVDDLRRAHGLAA